MPSEKLLSALIMHLQPGWYLLHPGHHTAARQCSLIPGKHTLYSYKLLIWLKKTKTKQEIWPNLNMHWFTCPVIDCNVMDTDNTKTNNQCQRKWMKKWSVLQRDQDLTLFITLLYRLKRMAHWDAITQWCLTSKWCHDHCNIGVDWSINKK